MVKITNEETNELRSGITTGFNKNLNSALSIGPSIRYWLTNRVKPALLTGVLKGGFGTPGIVAAINVEKEALGNGLARLSTTHSSGLKGKLILKHTGTATNGSTALLTVNEGKVFYLLQAGINYHATVDEKVGSLFETTPGVIYLRALSSINATKVSDSNTFTITYPHPIPVLAGRILTVDSDDAGLTCFGWVVGYEDDA